MLNRLAGFQKLFQRQRLHVGRLAFWVGNTPIQNAADFILDGAFCQAKNFLSAMIGEGDIAQLVGDDDAHDHGDEDPDP